MNNETKEDFCGACAAIPLAFVGLGVGAYGSTGGSKGKYKNTKTIMFWSGIITVIFALLVIVYFKYIVKCKECES